MYCTYYFIICNQSFYAYGYAYGYGVVIFILIVIFICDQSNSGSRMIGIDLEITKYKIVAVGYIGL